MTVDESKRIIAIQDEIASIDDERGRLRRELLQLGIRKMTLGWELTRIVHGSIGQRLMLSEEEWVSRTIQGLDAMRIPTRNDDG